MPKTKKQSNRNKLFTSISLNSNKGRLVLFLLVFAVIGGGFMLYKSFAATAPPTLWSGSDFVFFRAIDNLYDSSYNRCATVSVKTPQGNLVRCYQVDQLGYNATNGQFRLQSRSVNYYVGSNVLIPNSDWTTPYYSSKVPNYASKFSWLTCSDNGNEFAAIVNNLPYGSGLKYGQEFRKTSTGYQAAYTTMDRNYKCGTTSGWYNIVGPWRYGDLNGDGAINILDLSIQLSYQNQPGGYPQGDLDSDSRITSIDNSILKTIMKTQ